MQEVKTFGLVFLEWLAAQPYPSNPEEFVRYMIDKARELTSQAREASIS